MEIRDLINMVKGVIPDWANMIGSLYPECKYTSISLNRDDYTEIRKYLISVSKQERKARRRAVVGKNDTDLIVLDRIYECSEPVTLKENYILLSDSYAPGNSVTLILRRAYANGSTKLYKKDIEQLNKYGMHI